MFKKNKLLRKVLIDLIIQNNKLIAENIGLEMENIELGDKLEFTRDILTGLSLSILSSRKVTDDELIEGVIKSIDEQL